MLDFYVTNTNYSLKVYVKLLMFLMRLGILQKLRPRDLQLDLQH